MKHLIKFSFLLILITMISCESTDTAVEDSMSVTLPTFQVIPLEENVMTAEAQAALSPQSVIQALKDGNKRFTNNELTARDHTMQVRKATTGQFPKAVVLSCLDSRIPVEDVFDKGIGDLFVARVAGNFVNEDILGSMEFGCKVAGSKAIVVMGHENCGAIKAAVDGVILGNITAMLEKIKPALDMLTPEDGERTSKNAKLVRKVCENNVINTVAQIRKNSPILNEMEQNGEIVIVGAIYDMDTGEIQFLD